MLVPYCVGCIVMLVPYCVGCIVMLVPYCVGCIVMLVPYSSFLTCGLFKDAANGAEYI